jgi:hypothetical protein
LFIIVADEPVGPVPIATFLISEFKVERLYEGLPAGPELCLQPPGAVALGTGPWLGTVPVAAIAPCVRILDGEQLEVFLPISTFFGERSWAETHFHPMNCSIVVPARAFHITEVFVTGNGAAPKGFIADRTEQILPPSRFHSSSD